MTLPRLERSSWKLHAESGPTIPVERSIGGVLFAGIMAIGPKVGDRIVAESPPPMLWALAEKIWPRTEATRAGC